MTQITPPNDPPAEPGQPSEGEAPAPTFKPFIRESAPAKPSRKPLIIVAVSVALIVVGLIFFTGGPDDAEAKPAVLDVGALSADELAQNASAVAARELARRMTEGSPAERAAAGSALNRRSSPRLIRNFAMAMALQQQKKANDMNLRIQRDQMDAMGPDYPDMPYGR